MTPQPIPTPVSATIHDVGDVGDVGDVDFSALAPDEFRPDAGSEPAWLWTGYILPRRLTLLTSLWKCGKSTLLSLLIARMGAGGTLAGRAVRPGRVLVVSEEDQELWAPRCRRLGIGGHARFMFQPFFGRRPTLEEWWALVRKLIERHRTEGLDLVVIDALAGFVPDGTENDSGTILRMLEPLHRLKTLGVAVLVLHHPSKGPLIAGQAARGSGALSGNADIILEMDGLSGPTTDDRRRKIAGFSRFPETTRRLVIELSADGTDYAALGDFDAPELDDNWQILFQVLEDAHGKLTRRGILDAWPPDYRKPDESTVWRWLQRGIKDGRVIQGGTGHKEDPFRYWLDGMEEVWKTDPYYLRPLPPIERPDGMQRKTLTEVLAERNEVTHDSSSEQAVRSSRRARRATAGGGKRLAGDRPDPGVPPADAPPVADRVPGVVGVRDPEG